MTFGHGEHRHEVGIFVEFDVAPLGNKQGVVARFRQFRPHCAHFIGGLQVEILRIKPEALFI